MGAVQIETGNPALMAIADYTNRVSVKFLLKNFRNLRGLADSGDDVALAIVIDLKTAIIRGSMTDVQRHCLVRHYIDKESLNELANDQKVTEESIRKRVLKGLERLMKDLESGTLYTRGERP